MILGVFAGVALVALTVNLLLLKFLKTLGMKDQPGKIQVRWSAQSKPTIGGISFFVGFLVLMVVLLAGYPAEDGTLPLLLAATLAFFAGLLDDAFNTKPFMKFLFQSACAMVLIAGGWVIDLDSPPLSWVITFLWITGLMNSINMLDNMDGISSITAMCIFLGLFLL
ncbi:MAG: hypothetical protein RL226_1379, partial [Bacteroidota bacterium]